MLQTKDDRLKEVHDIMFSSVEPHPLYVFERTAIL